jgi:ATP/maltotriose-dependent transcriptional regulator MalT
VTFHYNSDAKNTPRFGLIAEEVAEVSPDLVIRDKEAKALSVRYEDVNAMLLNEFLKEHRKVQEQAAKIEEEKASIAELKSVVAKQAKGMEALAAHVREQDSQIQKVCAQIEMSMPASQAVTNHR